MCVSEDVQLHFPLSSELTIYVFGNRISVSTKPHFSHFNMHCLKLHYWIVEYGCHCAIFVWHGIIFIFCTCTLTDSLISKMNHKHFPLSSIISFDYSPEWYHFPNIYPTLWELKHILINHIDFQLFSSSQYYYYSIGYSVYSLLPMFSLDSQGLLTPTQSWLIKYWKSSSNSDCSYRCKYAQSSATWSELNMRWLTPN